MKKSSDAITGLFCLVVEAVCSCYYKKKYIYIYKILEQVVSTLKDMKTLPLLSFVSSNKLHSCCKKGTLNKNQLPTMPGKNVNIYY